MTTLLFLLGIVLITLLARYNESNKLFWTLFTCYTLGFVGAKLIYDVASEKKSSSITAVQPTQELAVTSGSLVYLLADDSLSTPVKVTSNPVSQANITVVNNTILSGVSEVIRGPYIHILPNPPNNVGIVDDS
jgi:hypothetical protein